MTGAGRSQFKICRWPEWALWGAALAGLAYLAGLTAWLGLAGLFFPYQLDYGEGVLLHFVREWSQGRPIYNPGYAYPYITANYPPLTILAALLLVPLLGLSYAAGRLWTLLAILAVAGLIVAWIWREGKRWLPAVAAGLLWAGSPYLYHWAPLFRADLVGLALTLGGLAAVNAACSPRAGEQPRRDLLLVGSLLFLAALYTKHSFLFAPAAALAYLVLRGHRRQAAGMALTLLALGAGLFVLINHLTQGGFWFGMVASNVNPFLWPEFWKQQADFFRTFAGLVALALWYLVAKLASDRSTPLRSRVGLADCYLVAALVSLWFAGKAGAWENYFFEALTALALCAGLGLARLRRSGKLLPRLAAPLLVLLQLGLAWHTPHAADRYLQLTQESNQAIKPILTAAADPILSEDMGLLVTNGKRLDYYSFQYSQLARTGRWDQAWELEQLRRQRFSLVILEQGTRLDVDRYQRFTRELLSELDRNYGHVQTVGKYELYAPDPLQHQRRVEYGDQLALVGWSLDAPPEPGAGDSLRLTAVWQAQQPPAADYTAFAHLVGEDGRGWAGDDHQPHQGLYPTRAWGAGEMVRDSFALTVPADAPPGLYELEVGWYSPALERLPVTCAADASAAGHCRNEAFRIAVLPVDWATTESAPLQPAGARFGEAITLEGFGWQVEPQAVEVTLRWSAERPLAADYTVFVHLVRPDGTTQSPLAQGDAPPLGGRWPTSLWLPGVALDDRHTVPLPDGLAPGSYDLVVGLYDPITGQRLALPDGAGSQRLATLTRP